jgi:tetratricopeptide (TPR) repeat protein
MKRYIFVLFVLGVFFISGYAQINRDNLRYSAVKRGYEVYRIDGKEQDKTFSESFKKKDTIEKETTLDRHLQYALSPLYAMNVNSPTHFRDVYPMIIAKRTAVMSQIVDIEPQAPFEPPKDIQPMKIPYSVKIKFDENEVTIYSDRLHDITYRFHTGKYLKSAINYYIYPHFDPNSGKAVSLYISTSNIECVEGYEEKKEKSIVNITLRTEVYYNDIILYELYTKIIFSDYSIMWKAAHNAIIEAVKKIPNEVAWVLSNPEEARLILKQKINPQISYDFIAFANLSRFTKHYDEAIVAAKRAIEINPNESAAYAVLGLIYQEQKNYKEAEGNFQKAIAFNPKTIYYLKLANLYYEKESYNEAVNTLTKALEIDPSNMEANHLLINTYMAMGQFDKAIESANKAIKHNTTTGVGIGIKAEGDYPVVETVLEEGPAKMAGIETGDIIKKINKQSIEGLKVEDVVNLLRGEEGTQVTLTIKRGDKEFEKTITRKTMINKKASVFFAQRSLCYRGKGNLELAMKDVETAYSFNPNANDTKEALGAVYIDKGKYDEAINTLSSASKDSNFAKVLLATAYAKAGKFKEALNTYTDIPEDYLITKSVLRNNAINAFYATLKPYKNTIAQQAKTFEAKGQYKEAIKEYASFLKIADEKEAKGIRAHIAELMIRYPHLFALSEEARKTVIKAEAYTSEGRFEKAIEEYKKVLEISPFFPGLYKALAYNYGQIKDYKKAIKNLNIYLELVPDAPDFREAKDQIYKWEFMMEKGE